MCVRVSVCACACVCTDANVPAAELEKEVLRVGLCYLERVSHVEVGSDVEASAAALEEQEALAIQQRLAQQLDDADFGLDIFTVSTHSSYCTQTQTHLVRTTLIFTMNLHRVLQAPEPEQAGEEPRDQEGHKIEKDLSTLSKKEKMKVIY